MGRNNFFQEFEYGASAQGYWTYDRMVLQLEYCTNILEYLHPGIYFICIFDNYCGYDRGIEDQLYVTNTKSGHGSEKQNMHPPDINQEDV